MASELDKLLEIVDTTTILSNDDWNEVNESMIKIRPKWFEIGVGLKIDRVFLEELEDKNLNPERALIKTLGRWLVHYNEVKLGGKPTWRMLARIAGQHQMDVAREIARNHPTTQQQQPPHQQAEELKKTVSGPSQEVSLCTASALTAETTPVEPCQPLTVDQARITRQYLVHTFISLVNQTKKHLIDTTGLCGFLNGFILCLPLSVRDEHEKFFKENVKEIRQLSSFDELFDYLNLYWSYLNYNLLECIIEQIENEELQEGIKQFSTEVRQFQDRTQLKVFGKIEPALKKQPPPGFVKIVIEHSITAQSTLSSIDSIRFRVAEHFSLHRFVLTLAQVVPGSVIATWFMPRSVMSLLLCGLTAELLDELHIVSIKIVEDVHDHLMKGKTVSMPPPLEPEILRFAATGQTAWVEDLIGQATTHLSATDKYGMTALMWAAANGHTDTVESLVFAGAELNSRNRDGETALMFASKNGHTESQKVLLEAGAKVNIRTKNGRTALMLASQNGHTESQKVLLEAGADFNTQTKNGRTALMFASQNGHTESQKVLLEAGADYNTETKNGWTALMFACRNGHTEPQKVLLEAGADYNTETKNGWTALMLASENGHTESQKVLLEAGADFNTQTKNGWTALMFACRNGHPESQKVLLEAGADFNIQMERGWTALMLASKNGHTESQKVLLEAGADFNIQMKRGRTALMLASQNGHTESQKVLLEAEADFNTQTKDGRTALMLASQNGHTESQKVLLEAGAEVNIQMKNGRTALMLASQNGHTESQKVLLEAEADFTAKTQLSKTALMMASEKNHTESMKLLLEAGACDTESKETLLRCYVQLGQADKVKELVEAGADINAEYQRTPTGPRETIFEVVNKAGHANIIDILLKAKAESYNKQVAKDFGFSPSIAPQTSSRAGSRAGSSVGSHCSYER